MSSADRVPVITNQRYTSDDLNTLQNLWARWLTDVFAYDSAYVLPSVNTAAIPVGSIASVVLGGLEVNANGVSVDVRAGALMEASPIAPVTDDPITRMAFGFNLATTTLLMPAPVSDTWCLVQAQVQDVADPTTTVDIWDGTAFVPTASQVKRYRRTLSLSIKTGTATAIPNPDAGRLPLAGVFRPAGGGTVLPEHIVDMRPFQRRIVGNPHQIISSYIRTDDLQGTNTTIQANVRVMTPHGEMSFQPSASPATSFQPEATAWKATGSAALTADSWWYLYMCPAPVNGIPGIKPRHLYANYLNEGMLVLSDVAPRALFRDNGAQITLPPPFASTNVPAGNATFVGAIRRNSANTGWVPFLTVGDKTTIYDKASADVGGGIPLALFTAVGGTNLLPAGAKCFDAEVSQNASAAMATRLVISDPTGALQRTTIQGIDSNDGGNATIFRDVDLTVGQSLQVDAVAGGGGTYQATILGFKI